MSGLAADDPRYLAAAELASRAHTPALSQNVLFGTAGWTDKTLLESKRFYPKGVNDSRGRLEFYASQFSLVEVDATYYSLLPPEVSQRWVSITPNDFRFDVKAFPVLTGHPVDVRRLPADLREALEEAGHDQRVYPDRMPAPIRDELERRFRALVEPLHEAGKLGAVFTQFPPWFTATRGNARHIEALAERWAGVPLAVEFRHPSWLAEDRRQRVLGLLERHGLSYVCVDEPDVEQGGVPPLVAVTNPELAVVRFHGHNLGGWRKKGASVQERFDYLYSPEELGAWVEPVRELASRAKRVHAIFNNCVRDFAVLNAKGLSVLLSAPE